MKRTTYFDGPWTVTVEGTDRKELKQLEAFIVHGNNATLMEFATAWNAFRLSGFGAKIDFIKAIREVSTGMGLKEAKELAESMDPNFHK